MSFYFVLAFPMNMNNMFYAIQELISKQISWSEHVPASHHVMPHAVTRW